MFLAHGMEDKIVKVVDINPCLTCGICDGYFVNATTITECMHTFCKSCLVKHLKWHKTCPVCQVVIHPSQPLRGIRADQRLQELANKLVPGLSENEKLRELEFYREFGPPEETKTDQNLRRTDHLRIYSGGICIRDHQYVCMESLSDDVPPLDRKFLLVPRQATILQLKKLVASKVLNDADKWGGVDIFCDDELQGKEHSIEFVYVTRWRKRNPILVLHYSCKMSS